MKTILFIFSLALVFLFSQSSFADDSFLGHAPDRGVIISVTPNNASYKSGEKVKFQGSIRVTNKSESENKKSKSGLLEEFRKQGIGIVASFPSEAIDVSSSLVLQSVNESEIKFSFESSAIQASELNQFSLKVYNNQRDIDLLKRLSKIKAKLDKRILALNNLLNENRGKQSAQESIEYIQKQIDSLAKINSKISARLNSDENLMAENTYAIQVDNILSKYSRLSTVMNRYRFLIESDPGTASEGMSIKIKGKITNLRKSDNDSEDEEDDNQNGYKIADFILNGQYLFTSPQKVLNPEESISYEFENSKLLASVNNIFTISLFNTKKNKRASRIGTLSQNIVVIKDAIVADTVPPVLASNVLSNALVNNNKIHIFVSDSSSVTTYVWDNSQQLLQTTAAKEFDIALSEGLNNFVVQSVDASNNKSPYLYLSNITLDSIPPNINAILASEYIYSSYPQTFTISINSDEDLQALTVNNFTATMLSPRVFTYLVTVDQPGVLSLNLKAFDLAGNQTIKTYSPVFGIDNIAPVLSSNAQSNSYTNQNTIQINVVDNSATVTDIYVDGVFTQTTSLKNFILTLNQGANNFLIKSRDIYNNEALDLRLDNIVYDITPASISSNNVSPSYLFNSLPQNLSFNFTASEALSYAEINGTQVGITNSNQISYVQSAASAGSKSLNLKVQDLAGNLSSFVFNFDVILDDVKPIVTIGSVPSLTNLNQATVGFNIVDSSATSTKIKLNGNEIATVSEKTFSYVLDLNEGVNTIEAVATDAAGNISDLASKQISKDSTAPILSSILPASGYKSNELLVPVSGVSNEKLQSVLVNGQQAVLSTDAMSFSSPFIFADFGSKIITIEATDLAGNTTTETQSIILKDLSAPVITTNLSNGYMTFDLININVTGDYLSNLRVVINDVEFLSANTNTFSSSFPFGQGVEHRIEIYATNSTGQEAHSSFITTLDSQAPFINISNVLPQTTQDVMTANYNFWDASPTTFRVFVDQIKIYESNEMVGSFDIPLLTQGVHTVSVTAIDAAGNMAEPLTFEILKDNTAPVITILEPSNGYVDGNLIKVTARVDDQVVSIRANGSDMQWNDSEAVWELSLGASNVDEFTITVQATNQLNLTGEASVVVRPLFNPLVPSLVGLYTDSINNKMIVRGAEGSTRPFLFIDVYTSFFSSVRVQADDKGAFMASLDPKDEYTVSVKDPMTGVVHKQLLTRYHQDVILSGRVKDNNDTPLAGVIVSIGTDGLQATTDANGVFTFNKADYPDSRITGDQKIIIDGRNAQSSATQRPHKFSLTTMNVSLSYKLNNVIQDTIYLYPTYLDSDSLNASGGGTIVSPEAPGVSLTAQSDVVAVFPSGASAEPITMHVVPADRLTIKPPAEAMPEQVLVLEPSGTIFYGSVDLTVPNYSNFPPQTSMILMLFNSQTGRWEAGGAGRVSEDGASITTKQDQGLRHFSDGYFIPTPADLLAMNVPDKPGADSFSGAVTNKIDLPSFKVMGQSVSPSLIYKSSWAKPSTTITNIFNFADKEVIMAPYSESGSVAQAYSVDVISCGSNVITENLDSLLSVSSFSSFWWVGMLKNAHRNLDPAGYERAKTAAINDMQASHKLPANCTASGEKQKFYNNYDYTNTYSDLKTKISPKLVEMTLQTADIQTTPSQFKNLQTMSQLSKFIELKNQNNEYLATGLYPYVAKYKIFYDKLVTGTVKTNYVDKITGAGSLDPKPINNPTTYLQDPSQFFGSDLIENLFVQNYRNSEAGQGWKIAGTQKIVNPQAQKIMIEEADGSIATYSVKNSIRTVVDLNSISGDLTKGVSLNQWPNFTFTEKDTKQIKQANLGTSSYNVSSIGQMPEVKGTISGFTFYNWTSQGDAYTVTECVERYYFPGGNVCTRFESKTYYTEQPHSTCKVNAYQYKQDSNVVQYLSTATGAYMIDNFRNTLGYIGNNQYQDLLGNKLGLQDVRPWIYGTSRLRVPSDPYSTEIVFDSQNVNTFISQVPGLSLIAPVPPVTNPTILRDETYNAYNACGPIMNVPMSTGDIYWSNSAYIANPSSIIVSNDPNVLLIANTGISNVVSYNTSTGEQLIIAGTGVRDDGGDNGLAINAGIFEPRGLVQDAAGNLYISTNLGHIRKIDTNGTITTVAGDALNGKYLFEGEAKTMKFNNPYGLAYDEATHSLFVADTGYNRVVKIDIDNNFATTVAGNGQNGFSGDGGAGIDASLSAPTFLQIDASRNLIIADSGNNRIRSLTLNDATNTELAFEPTKPDHSILTKKADGSWERKYRNGQKELFNSQGFHISSASTNGLSTVYQYDGNNKLTKVVFPNNDQIQYNYSGNQLDSITDPSGKNTVFSYNYLNQLTSVSYPDNSRRQFGYNQAGLMTEEINQKGFVSNYLYNQYDRIQKILLSDGSEVKIGDSASKGLQEKDASGVYIPSSAYTNKESITDANGNIISMAKDATGYISTIIDPRGRTQKIKRDLDGRPIEITDVDGSIVQSTYDPTYGDLIQTTNLSLDITTQTQYNIYGQAILQIDPYGKTSTKDYNGQLQLVKETAPDGKYLTYEYNSLGLVTKKSNFSQANVLKNKIIYEYNGKGQLTKQTDLNNKFSSYTYDLAGNVLTSISNIDGSTQSVTVFEYDRMNRLTKVTSPKGEVTEYSYSLAGELLQIKDPNQKVTSFEYSNKGELIRKTDPAGLVYEMSYDKNGNLLTEKDPANQLKQYAYNEINKITQVQTADDLIQYQYNIKDEVLQIASNTSTVTYQWDTKQRIIQEVVSGVNYPDHVLNIAYSKNDLRISLQSNFQNIAYSYNQDTYQLVGLNSSATGSYNFNYDDANRLASIARPGSRTDYTYDVGSVLTRISHSANGVEKSFHEYSYDLRNYITQKRSPASTLNYSYDSNGQLTSANKDENSNENESFSYDALGNRLTYNGVPSTYDNSGQRIQDDGQYTYVYDANGNIIYKSSKSNGTSYSFEYSALNQLKKATVTSSPLGGSVLKVLEYKYDPVGRRIIRSVVDNVNSNKSNLKKYYYDGSNILAELDAENNLTASYTHSPLRADDVLGAKFTNYAAPSGAISDGQVLAQSAGYVYYLKDHLNTINEVVNAAGDVVQKMDYSVYGVLRSVKDSNGVDVAFENAPVRTSFTYTGREFEPELNMYYYRARYYDPSTGRFLQVDPDPGNLGSPKTFLSKYIYGANNPAMFSDPTGKSIIGDLIDSVLNFGHNAIAAFGSAFDNLVKDKGFQKLVVLIVAAVVAFYLAPAIVAAFGITGGGTIAATALWGGVVGGIVGGFGFTTFGLGTFSEGFQLGAIVGSIAGGFNYGASTFVKGASYTASKELGIQIFGYGVQAVGWAEPIFLIPTWWSCKDPNGQIGTSGIIGSCNDK